MRSIPFPGGWYTAALPDGRWVSLKSDYSIATDKGIVPITLDPAGVVSLYPVLNPAAPLDVTVFAGQAADAYGTLEWNGSAWSLNPIVACGVYGCIYRPDGELVINVNCGVGVNGYRYVRPDGSIASGDETYAPNGQWNLYGWTELSLDLAIGQGPNGGVLVDDAGTYRVFVDPPANIQLITVQTTGQTDADTFGLGYWGQGVDSAAWFGTLAELRALPVYQSAPTPQPPTPIPPQPPEVPMILTAAFVLDHPERGVLGRGANEHERRENAFRFSNTVARDANRAEGTTRYGVLEKTSGANAFGYAADIIVDRQTAHHFDVVAASESPDARPSFQDHGPIDLNRWRPTDPRYYVGGPVTPTPQPPTPQPPVPPAPGQPTNADIYAAIARVEAKLDRVFRA